MIGLDLTGASGGVVRIDDIEIEDVTHLFAADLAGVVDVRDYGARGDGTGNEATAFAAADAAAAGRTVLVPEGRYRLASDVTFRSHVRFVGTVEPVGATKLILQRDFRFGAYLDALGNEELAFTKAFQALLSFSDHESLDLEGRRIAPNIKLAMVVPGSGLVKAQAEAEGLDKILAAAGFEWRDPGCSMCIAMNGDILKPGERCASTSNRNFKGRQGRDSRTHLVGPAMAAAAAIAGHFVDVRDLAR